jgi:hypothetical protein
MTGYPPVPIRLVLPLQHPSAASVPAAVDFVAVGFAAVAVAVVVMAVVAILTYFHPTSCATVH